MDRFTRLPLPYQLGILLFVAGGLIAVFEYVGGDLIGFPALNPLKAAKDEQITLQIERDKLEGEVALLETFKAQLEQRERDLAEAEAQLAILRVQVPNEKLTDNFLRSLEGNALASQISVRELVSQPVVFKEFYAELPFQMNLDGPYFNLRDYFERVGSTERITNVSGLDLNALEETASEYQYTPGSTVKGNVNVTTYYIPSEDELAANAPPAGPPGSPAARR